jgi:ABC-type sugar transport system ATPase subunit
LVLKDAGSGFIDGTIYAVEKLGDQDLIHVEVRGSSPAFNVIVRQVGNSKYRPHENVSLSFDPIDGHLFEEKGNVVSVDWKNALH